jgi:hypothetical protein
MPKFIEVIGGHGGPPLPFGWGPASLPAILDSNYLAERETVRAEQ